MIRRQRAFGRLGKWISLNASCNFSQLEQLLREESLLHPSDWENEDIPLSVTHVRSLHIFRAVQRFVQRYLESLIPTPDLSREMKLLFADVTRDILELLMYFEPFQLGILIVGVISLFIQAKKK